jgi:hypothetical protein
LLDPLAVVGGLGQTMGHQQCPRMLARPVARDLIAGASHGYDCGIMVRVLRTEEWGVQGQYRDTASGIAERRLA